MKKVKKTPYCNYCIFFAVPAPPNSKPYYMDNSIKNVSLSQLRTYIPKEFYISVDDDFLITHIQIDPVLHPEAKLMLGHPCRFDGYMAVCCLAGPVEVAINLETYVLKEKTVAFTVPGSIVRFSEHEPNAPVDLVVFVASKNFMSGVHVDFYKLFDKSMKVLNYPYFTIDEVTHDTCSKYVALVVQVMKMNLPFAREAIASLVTSMFYVISCRWNDTLDKSKQLPDSISPRVKLIFQQFLALVKEYHCQERSMGFYAGKLCLTPKYLSKLIKQASGRSAPEWIVDFVILEAKNLLKYSDCTIKEIVYKLNFPNQSVFYKFFKSHTGMTPSEYRRS